MWCGCMDRTRKTKTHARRPDPDGAGILFSFFDAKVGCRCFFLSRSWEYEKYKVLVRSIIHYVKTWVWHGMGNREGTCPHKPALLSWWHEIQQNKPDNNNQWQLTIPMHLSKSFSNSVVRAFPAKKRKKATPRKNPVQSWHSAFFPSSRPKIHSFLYSQSIAYHKSQFRYTPEYRVLS